MRKASWEDASGAARARSFLRAASGIALVVHVGAHAFMLARGHYFATEDDAYRVYLSFLLSKGGGVIGRFWPPGQFVLLGGLLRLGLDAAIAPLVLGVLALVVTLVALRSLSRDLAPRGWEDAATWGTTFVLFGSPLALELAHSALAEPISNAFVAIAGAGIARYFRTGSRVSLFISAVALGASTWVRYEAWVLAFAWPVLTFVLARRRGAGSATAAVDTAVASLSLVGPLAWMCAQAAVYGSPTAFLTVTDMAARDLEGAPSIVTSMATRSRSVALWMPEIVIAAGVALAHRAPRRPLGPLLVPALVMGALLGIQVASGRGFATFVVAGRTYDFFSARLVSGFALAMMPIAGLGLSSLLASPRVKWIGVVACAASVLFLVATPSRPLDFVDTSSLRVALRLRRGELDDRVGDGVLLVERPKLRPPLGWAAVGVLWQHWGRIVWATPQGSTWLMVDPEDVHNGRREVDNADLADWLARRGVTSAWTVSEDSRRAVLAAWPDARRLPIENGELLSR